MHTQSPVTWTLDHIFGMKLGLSMTKAELHLQTTDRIPADSASVTADRWLRGGTLSDPSPLVTG